MSTPALLDSPAPNIIPVVPSTENSSNDSAPPVPEKASPEFPSSAFVGLGGDFVNLYGSRLESPPEFLFTAWHACFGIAISPFVRLDSILNLPPRIYVVNLGSSAIPRKSTSIKVAIKTWETASFFADNPNERPFRVENGLGSVEGFVRVFNGWSKKDAVEQGGDTRPCLVVYDELRSFVEKSKQQGSTLLPFLTSMFEGEEYDNTTVNRHVTVRGCHLGLVGACTLDTFADMWTSDFMAIGFPNRLFLVQGNPRHRISLPEHPPATAVSKLQDEMQRLLGKIKERHLSGCGRIGLSVDAKKHWDDFYQCSMPRGIHAARLDTYALKWMMLLALSQEEFEIDRTTVDRAIDLIEYQLQVRRRYDPIDVENKYAHTEEKIRRYFHGRVGKTVKRRDLFQATNGSRIGNYIFDNAIENLVKSGEIQLVGKKQWRLNEEFEDE